MGAIAAGVLLLAFALGWPSYRLNRELAAARREGLWTETADVLWGTSGVPEAENAAPLIRATIAMEKVAPLDGVAIKLLKGTATSAETARLRRDILAHPETLAAWRLAATRPRVDYGRDWEEGAATLFPEFQGLKRGVKRLVVAARLGYSPKENLVAAARLADLTRQEPVILSTLVSASLGRIVLREAKRQGFSREVDASLGPPIDVRRAYAAELVFALDFIRNDGTDDWYRRMGVDRGPSLSERLTHLAPRRANETAAVVRDWRAMWHELGSGTDYPAAACAMRRWMPRVNQRMADWSVLYARLGYDSDEDAAWVPLALQRYAEERRKARKSRP